jgi:predicted dehydrogenase
MSLTRRRFIAGSMAAGAAVTFPLSVRSRALGANGDIRVAVVGVRGRGDTHIDWASDVPGVRVTTICDVDTKVLGSRADAMSKVDKFKGVTIEQVQDFRTLLDRKDIDVISIATPNHWHSLMSIMAIQAGKDVYVEKPVSHNIWEGRQLVAAARKYEKIVQAGTQSRTAQGSIDIANYIKSGELGAIKYAVATCYKPRGPIGKRDKPLDIPKTLDYDLWCGPAEKKEIFRDQLHYDWHWDFNTGNGDIGNQGVHEMDRARWFLGENAMPPKVVCIGGRVGYDDASNTPNTQIAYYAYEKAPLIFEVRGLPKNADLRDDGPTDGGGKVGKKWSQGMDDYKGARVGAVIHCEHGYVVSGSYNGGAAFDSAGKKIKSFNGGGDHYGNFIMAVRSRKHTDLAADIAEGHLSSALCHLANVSYRLGQKMTAAEIAEQIKGNAEYAEGFGRTVEHLKANKISLDEKNLAIGPMLAIDPKTETFIDNDAANKLRTREYRAPFVVPEIKA